jgi:hypothetical protein
MVLSAWSTSVGIEMSLEDDWIFEATIEDDCRPETGNELVDLVKKEEVVLAVLMNWRDFEGVDGSNAGRRVGK